MDRTAFSKLAPADAVAALRSFPRRFRAPLRNAERNDPDPEELADTVAPSGRSPREVVIDTARSLALLGHAVDQTLTHDEPTLHPAVLDRSRREWPAETASTVAEEIDLLEEEAGSFADVVERAPANAWGRTAKVADDGSTTAHELLTEAMATVSGNLRDFEADLAALRTRSR
ncbi:MAG: hypothetical protein S0880_21750 [Actinomycetota bacterium]|nr:hypothetical protein [Actinomycetota bacterium]